MPFGRRQFLAISMAALARPAFAAERDSLAREVLITWHLFAARRRPRLWLSWGHGA
jgi:hypothetical protein